MKPWRSRSANEKDRQRGIIAGVAGYTNCQLQLLSLGQGNFKRLAGPPIFSLPHCFI
jgi:hypothetical protein